jgi:anti-sigma factor RsiW
MNCDEAKRYVSGYVDNEWDLNRTLDIEGHLQSCDACRLAYASERATSAAVREHAMYRHAPAGLARRIRVTLDVPDEAPRAPTRARWTWLGASAGFVAAGVLAGMLTLQFLLGPDVAPLAEQVIDAHSRSLLANHITDVASSDQHTVKPWFNGRLDFSPPVRDLTSAGFPLVGGRLDYLDGRVVAALIYRHRQHFINLFVWPTAGPMQIAPERIERRGYHLIRWTQGGMTFWAVSDLNAQELEAFVQRLRASV